MEKKKILKADIDPTLFNIHEYNVNPLTREIFLNGINSNEEEECGIDYRIANQFIKNIKFLENQNNDNIIIHQCTVGGEYAYGMAIYNAIKECSCHVTVIAYSHARSMSSITIQAADERLLMPDCYFMIHHGTIFIADTHKGAVSYMEFAKQDANRMMEIYTERCKLSANEIEEKLNEHQEWYLTAEEAVKYGFADGIYTL